MDIKLQMEYKYQLLKYIYHIDYKARINPVYSNGQYLFETFTPYINREGLALPPSWNQITGIKQWQIKPETILLKGIADSQQLQGIQYIILEELNKYLFINLGNIKHYQSLKNEEKKGIRK